MSLIYKGKVVATAGQDFKLVNWRTHGLEFKLGRDAVKKRVVPCTQAVAHHTAGEGSYKSCYSTLKKRGLSIQFYQAQDGTIYQYCDLDLACQHAGRPTNGRSYGMEIACKGVPPAHPKWPRGIYRAEIHGRTRPMLLLYAEQIDAALAFFDFVNSLLDIPRKLPRTGISGKVPSTVVPLAERNKFKGLLAHYHISFKKIDPGTQFIAAAIDEGW